MNRSLTYLFKILVILLAIVFVSSCSKTDNNDFSERTQLALRDVGNNLLLTNQDSTSLILPVIELSTKKYQLKFSNTLSFEPNNLVSIVRESFKKTQLPEAYRVEVLLCNDREVAYSYQISMESERTIIPCAGRYLPESCYIIEIKFTSNINEFAMYKVVIYTTLIFLLLGLGFLVYKKRNSVNTKPENGLSVKIGSFHFYPNQNKLVLEASEIALSKKECELLALFVANPNQIITREELTKRVWEDNGVFVGRSLDTYISKLRKKLKPDTTIKLTNIHGVGYKLVIE